MTQSKKATPAPVQSAKPVEVELEDVVMVPDGGKDTFRVEVIRVRGPAQVVKVLEAGVSLPVARQASVLWRSKAGGLHRGLK